MSIAPELLLNFQLASKNSNILVLYAQELIVAKLAVRTKDGRYDLNNIITTPDVPITPGTPLSADRVAPYISTLIDPHYDPSAPTPNAIDPGDPATPRQINNDDDASMLTLSQTMNPTTMPNQMN